MTDIPVQDHVSKTGIKSFRSSKQKLFNRSVATMMESVLQIRRVGEIGYINSKFPGGPMYIAPLGKGSTPEVIKEETPAAEEQQARFQFDSLGIYERIVLSAVAWYRYDTYVIAGELGTGKTATTTFLLKHLKRLAKESKQETCKFCNRPIHIKINFNINFRSSDNEHLRHDLCEQLYDQLRLHLRRLFQNNSLPLMFLSYLRAGNVEHQTFAVFDQWIEELEKKGFDFTQVPSAEEGTIDSKNYVASSVLYEVLFDFVAADGENHEKAVRKLLALCRFIREYYSPDSWCFLMIFDNLDSVRVEGQGVLLQLILSFQQISQVKTLVPLRPSTFATVESERAFSYGLIEHAGPGILEILTRRLEHLLNTWDTDTQVATLPSPEIAEHLKRRLEYVQQTCCTGEAMEILTWLAGNNVRQGMELAGRIFDTEVISHDMRPRHKYDCFRAILTGKSESQQIERDDRYVANLYCQDQTGKFSTINWRILQLAYGLRKDSSIRTIAAINEYLSMLTDFDPRRVIDAYNYLMDRNRQLVRVDGVSSLKSEDDLSKGYVVAATKAGESYLRFLFRELTYVQECFTAALWPSEDIPKVVNFRSTEERLRFVRKCLRHLLAIDEEEVKNMRDALGTVEITPGNRLRLLSNRILYKTGLSALQIMKSQKRWYKPRDFVEELRDWESLLKLGFESERNILDYQYERLPSLASSFGEAAIVSDQALKRSKA